MASILDSNLQKTPKSIPTENVKTTKQTSKVSEISNTESGQNSASNSCSLASANGVFTSSAPLNTTVTCSTSHPVAPVAVVPAAVVASIIEQGFPALAKTTKPIPASVFSYRFASPTNNKTPYYISSDIVLSGGIAQQTRRRIVHNEVERRRKCKINNWITRLAEVVPGCTHGKQSKNIVLEKSVEYLKDVNAKVSQMCDMQQTQYQLAVDNQVLRDQLDTIQKHNKELCELLHKHNIPIPDQLSLTQKTTVPTATGTSQESDAAAVSNVSYGPNPSAVQGNTNVTWSVASKVALVAPSLAPLTTDENNATNVIEVAPIQQNPNQPVVIATHANQPVVMAANNANHLVALAAHANQPVALATNANQPVTLATHANQQVTMATNYNQPIGMTTQDLQGLVQPVYSLHTVSSIMKPPAPGVQVSLIPSSTSTNNGNTAVDVAVPVVQPSNNAVTSQGLISIGIPSSQVVTCTPTNQGLAVVNSLGPSCTEALGITQVPVVPCSPNLGTMTIATNPLTSANPIVNSSQGLVTINIPTGNMTRSAIAPVQTRTMPLQVSQAQMIGTHRVLPVNITQGLQVSQAQMIGTHKVLPVNITQGLQRGTAGSLGTVQAVAGVMNPGTATFGLNTNSGQTPGVVTVNLGQAPVTILGPGNNSAIQPSVVALSNPTLHPGTVLNKSVAVNLAPQVPLLVTNPTPSTLQSALPISVLNTQLKPTAMVTNLTHSTLQSALPISVLNTQPQLKPTAMVNPGINNLHIPGPLVSLPGKSNPVTSVSLTPSPHTAFVVVRSTAATQPQPLCVSYTTNGIRTSKVAPTRIAPLSYGNGPQTTALPIINTNPSVLTFDPATVVQTPILPNINTLSVPISRASTKSTPKRGFSAVEKAKRVGRNTDQPPSKTTKRYTPPTRQGAGTKKHGSKSRDAKKAGAHSKSKTPSVTTQNRLTPSAIQRNVQGASARPNGGTNTDMCQQEDMLSLQNFSISSLIPCLDSQTSGTVRQKSPLNSVATTTAINRDSGPAVTQFSNVTNASCAQTIGNARLSHSIASLTGRQEMQQAHVGSTQQQSHQPGGLNFSAESLFTSGEDLLHNIASLTNSTACQALNPNSTFTITTFQDSTVDTSSHQGFSNYSAEALIGGADLMTLHSDSSANQVSCSQGIQNNKQTHARTQMFSDFSAESLINSSELGSGLSYAIDNLIARSDSGFNSSAMVTVNPNLIHNVSTKTNQELAAPLRGLQALPDTAEQRGQVMIGAAPAQSCNTLTQPSYTTFAYTSPQKQHNEAAFSFKPNGAVSHSGRTGSSTSPTYLKHSVDSITSSLYGTVSSAPTALVGAPINNTVTMTPYPGLFPNDQNNTLQFSTIGNGFTGNLSRNFHAGSTMGSFA